MPIYNGGGGVAGITVENDPSALKLANNLSDLPNLATARTNLQLSTYFAALNHNHNGTYATVSHTHAASTLTGWGNIGGAASGFVLGWDGQAILWVPQSGGISDAPADGVKYGRINNTWSAITEGVNGTNGTNGQDGSLINTYEGAYDNGVTYAAGDVVTSNGTTYMMTTAIGAGGYAPEAYPANWSVIALKGLGFTYKGTWTAYTTYVPNDWVSFYNGSTTNGFLCTVSTDSATDPATLTSNWVPCGGQGPVGPAGPTGEAGATGAQGPAGDVSYSGLKDHFIQGSNGGPTTNGSSATGYVLTNVDGSNYNWVGLPAQVVTSASAGTNNSGYSNAQFDTTHYPSELALTINGTTYYVPART